MSNKAQTVYEKRHGVTPIWLRQVATALSTRYNVKVKEGKGWAMNIQTRVLTYDPRHLLALDRDTCLGLLLHELGHLHFTKSDWAEDGRAFEKIPKGIVFNAVNCFEDVRVNEKMSKSYNGSRALIDTMNELLGSDGVSKVLEMHESIKRGEKMRTHYTVSDWYEIFYVSMVKMLGNNLFPEIKPSEYYDSSKMAIINDIVREGERQNIKEMQSTSEVYEFVRSYVLPKIHDFLPLEVLTNPTGQGSGKGAEGNKEGAEGNKEGAEGNKEGAEGNEEGAGGNEEGAEGNEEGAGGNEEGAGGNEDTQTKKKREKPHVQEIGGEHWKKAIENKVKHAIKTGRINPDEQNRTEPFDRLLFRKKENKIPEDYDVAKHLRASTQLARMFKNKFEAIYRDNQYAREEVNQKSGRLNKRTIYKYPLGNTRLFKKKIEATKKSYAVSFGFDVSGSMRKQQTVGSFYALLAFMHALEAMNVNHSVGFFSDEYSIGKSFEKKLVPDYMARQGLKVSKGGTDLREFITDMLGRKLIAQNVTERVAVILTDGEWEDSSYDKLRLFKRANPKVHVYVVTLGLNTYSIAKVNYKLGTKMCTVMHASTPEEIISMYVKIARKHFT